MDRLISMTDFVMQQNMHYANKYITVEKLQLRILNYAMFLKQTLTLGMFVPCDLDGNVLQEAIDLTEDNFEEVNHKIIEYEEAKDRFLFEGFKWINSKCISTDDIDIYFDSDGIKAYNVLKITDLCSIENLIEFNLELTQTAQKQIS